MFANPGSVLVCLPAAGINAQIETNFRREGWILFHHWGEPTRESKTGAWRQTLKQNYGGKLLTGLHPESAPCTFLYNPVGWDSCPSISNQQNVPQTCPKVNLLGGWFLGEVGDFSTKVPSSQMCRVDKHWWAKVKWNKQAKTLAMWHIYIHIKCPMYIHTLQEDMVGVVAFHARLPIHFVH